MCSTSLSRLSKLLRMLRVLMIHMTHDLYRELSEAAVRCVEVVFAPFICQFHTCKVATAQKQDTRGPQLPPQLDCRNKVDAAPAMPSATRLCYLCHYPRPYSFERIRPHCPVEANLSMATLSKYCQISIETGISAPGKTVLRK